MLLCGAGPHHNNQPLILHGPLLPHHRWPLCSCHPLWRVHCSIRSPSLWPSKAQPPTSFLLLFPQVFFLYPTHLDVDYGSRLCLCPCALTTSLCSSWCSCNAGYQFQAHAGAHHVHATLCCLYCHVRMHCHVSMYCHMYMYCHVCNCACTAAHTACAAQPDVRAERAGCGRHTDRLLLHPLPHLPGGWGAVV